MRVTAAVCVAYSIEQVERVLDKVRELVPDAKAREALGHTWIMGTVPVGTTQDSIRDAMALAGIGALRIVIEVKT